MNHKSSESFTDQVRSIPGGEHLELCYSCGTCVSKCMIQQKVEPEYNPRRLLRMVIMDMRDEAFENPTTWLCTACDLCYAACPQEIHISAVLGAVKQLGLSEGFQPLIKPAVVNQQTCIGCGLCVEVCPYQAIDLEKTDIPNRGKGITIAKVNPDKCMGCGLCSAVCRSASIELTENNSSEVLVEKMRDWLMQADLEVRP